MGRRAIRMGAWLPVICIVIVACALLPGGAAAASPVANFTANPLSGTAPLSVTFTDLSVNATGWAWDFDNNGIVDNMTANPVYTYTETGTYSVNLTVSNSEGSSSSVKSDYITVSVGGTGESNTALKASYVAETLAAAGGPVASFMSSTISGTAPLTITFTDTSTGTVTSRIWTFGDGNTSCLGTTTNTFSSPGIYPVTLTVANSFGSDTATQTITVNTVSGKPGVAFSASPLSGAYPLAVQFTDQSSDSPYSWLWNFGDGNTSSSQNPTHTYSSTGTYSVTLTATNSIGSDSLTKSSYISVTPSSISPDLLVVNVVPNPGGAAGGYIFEREPNNIKVVVANNGPADAPASVLVVNSSDGFSATVSVPALTAGAQKQLLVVDTSVRATVGSGLVTYNTMLDPDNLIAESNEANNAATWDTPLVWNGYKGKALYRDGGLNSTTYETYDIHGGIVNSFGNSYYRSGSYGGGWNEFDVTWNGTQPYVPAGATVKEARLYLPYTWDNSNMMPTNVTVKFDGSDITSTYQHWYWDRGNFGEWGPFTYGLLAYNVTSLYQKDGTNWVNFTRPGDPNTKLSLYGMTLAIVYEDQNISRKQIFLNEGFDLLGADPVAYATNESEATVYLEFTGPAIDTANAVRVNLITFVPSGEGPEGNLFVNGQEVAANVWNYGALNQPVGENGLPQVAVDSRDVKSYLAAENNVIGIQSTQRSGGQPCMVAAQAFLVADYGPVAQFTNATPLSGSAPLSVTFADQSIGATGWLWDFGDGSNSTEENPTHTYNAAGTYSVKLIVTDAVGSDYTEMPNYVTVSTGVIALPGQANLPTDPDEDGMYEDLNGDGEIVFPDLQLYFVQMDWIVAHEPVNVFDYSRNGEIDFPDLQMLFAKI